MSKIGYRTCSGFLAGLCVAGALSRSSMPALGQVQDMRRTFTADFTVSQMPITAGGAWQHLGRPWTYVRSFDNRAVGTQTGSGGYDDSYAYLLGFGPNQSARATIWIDPAIKGDYREVELLLRWADTPTSARGYECNLAWNGAYAQIVRWNGRFGDFTYIANRTNFDRGIMPPKSGDILTATVQDDKIRVYLNKNDGTGDHLILTGRDGTFTDGNPGVGFFVQGDRDPAQFGFSNFNATSN